ncbi:pyridoxamine 5'-phosphate oxidase family protein [Myxococcota bacterium]|nr:pyridoxamine 5'-phosphate oxidase family protein [Myxococcota bacterium]
MNRAQEKFGKPIEWVVKKIEPTLNDMIQDFIRASPFCVLSTASAEGNCDASPKGGAPGFAKVLDPRRLLIPDVAGNKLFQSYENVDSNPNAGLLFLIPGCDWTVRVNGAARAVDTHHEHLDGRPAEVLWEDDNTKVLQGLMVEVREAYAHCPRAFLFSKLWDTERINLETERDANKYWFGRYRKAVPAA